MDSRVLTTAKVIGLFALLGVGIGLANFLVIDGLTTSQSANGDQNVGEAFVAGFIIIAAVTFLYFIGPAIAIATSLLTGRRESRRNSALTNGVGSLIGYYLMFILAFIIMSLAFPENGGTNGSPTSLGDSMMHFKVGIPTALVGAAAGAVTATD